jgi:transcriptional regulator with XRE-family HTH domain
VPKRDKPTPDMSAEGLPLRLISRRKALGLSQEEVAARLGLSRNAYGEYERGGSKMKLPQVSVFAAILDCSPRWLAFEEGPAQAR